MKKKDVKNPLPGKNVSRKELAQFWDTHSVADYKNELRRMKIRFAENLSEGITMRFDPESLEKLRQRAKKKGIGPTTLARMWILERLASA